MLKYFNLEIDRRGGLNAGPYVEQLKKDRADADKRAMAYATESDADRRALNDFKATLAKETARVTDCTRANEHLVAEINRVQGRNNALSRERDELTKQLSGEIYRLREWTLGEVPVGAAIRHVDWSPGVTSIIASSTGHVVQVPYPASAGAACVTFADLRKKFFYSLDHCQTWKPCGTFVPVLVPNLNSCEPQSQQEAK